MSTVRPVRWVPRTARSDCCRCPRLIRRPKPTHRFRRAARTAHRRVPQSRTRRSARPWRRIPQRDGSSGRSRRCRRPSRPPPRRDHRTLRARSSTFSCRTPPSASKVSSHGRPSRDQPTCTSTPPTRARRWSGVASTAPSSLRASSPFRPLSGRRRRCAFDSARSISTRADTSTSSTRLCAGRSSPSCPSTRPSGRLYVRGPQPEVTVRGTIA